MEIYIKLFEILFPVFFVVGVGYYIGKKDPKIDTKFIANVKFDDYEWKKWFNSWKQKNL